MSKVQRRNQSRRYVIIFLILTSTTVEAHVRPPREKSALTAFVRQRLKRRSHSRTSTSTPEHSEPVLEESEHPLRTDEWEIIFPGDVMRNDPLGKSLLRSNANRTRRKAHKGNHDRGSGHLSDEDVSTWRTAVTFKRNGHCNMVCPTLRQASNDVASKQTIRIPTGKWRIEHGKVFWDVPVLMIIDDTTDNFRNATGEKEEGTTNKMGLQATGMGRGRYRVKKITELHFVAEVHLNKFGEKPRMCKGIVTRDRFRSSILPPHVFRPVVATFSAKGVGEDTVDVVYKSRGIGLAPK